MRQKMLEITGSLNSKRTVLWKDHLSCSCKIPLPTNRRPSSQHPSLYQAIGKFGESFESFHSHRLLIIRFFEKVSVEHLGILIRSKKEISNWNYSMVGKIPNGPLGPGIYCTGPSVNMEIRQ
jgi:hypothetical protein